MIALNSSLIHERRLALSLSKRQLARLLGTTQPVISRLEDGGNPDLSKHNLITLCDVLSIHPNAIFIDHAHAEVRQLDDAMKVEAALGVFGRKLSAVELATGLEWTLPRTKRALAAAQHRLSHTGLRLHCTGGRYGLQPVAGVLRADEQKSLARAVVASVRISVRLAALLSAASQNKIDVAWEKSASNADRPLLGQLLNLGWIVRQGKRYVLAPEVEYSLGLRAQT
jgi:transcriptional regulator with XRE-family HTH domain